MDAGRRRQMMRVRCRVAPSDIQGLGCFTLQPIAYGTVVWMFDPTIDRRFTVEEYLQLPKALRRWLDRYVYLSQLSGQLVHYVDDARFINHAPATSANLRAISTEWTRRAICERLKVAIRDIAIGE